MSTQPSETRRRSPADVIADWWHGWRQSMRRASDLATCSEHEVERMARDVGLSGHELQRLVHRGPQAADLLLCRMAALNLDREEVAEADRATFLDLQRVCSSCDCKGFCKRELARDPDDPAWEDYCPNVATLKMLNALPWASRREW